MKEGWPKDHCGQDIMATCKPPWKVKTVTIIWAGLCGCYQIAYVLYNSAAKCRLDHLPYGRYRTGHALLAWQVGDLPPNAHTAVVSCHLLSVVGKAQGISYQHRSGKGGQAYVLNIRVQTSVMTCLLCATLLLRLGALPGCLRQ